MDWLIGMQTAILIVESGKSISLEESMTMGRKQKDSDPEKAVRITSCTIVWENTDDILSVVTKVLQTEIHVRLYNSGDLISGRIWPMSVNREIEKKNEYKEDNIIIKKWDCDDYSVDKSDSNHWQFKICTQRNCLRTVCGTIEPPPHGVEIKRVLAGIIGEDNCYFF